MVDLNNFPGLKESRKVTELKAKERREFIKLIIDY